MSARPFTFWRVLPLPGEPASSYFSRLVMDECSYLPENYASEIGINRIFRSDELLELIFLLPISEEYKERLRWWTPVEAKGSVRLAGQIFARGQFRWARNLQCRECVAETPYHRVWWQLECFRTCPVHHCVLEPLAYARTTSGRRWPRFDRVLQERVAHVESGAVHIWESNRRRISPMP
ncbi:TniQ family protein [Rhizobium sp. BR 317]|uniref:TniQ family protein n=1 Tax=Rhizobium sp. BR 317 TaxID=3040015 RepID=UPI0039BEFABF